MTNFQIKKFTDDEVMITKFEERNIPFKGLPPDTTQSIIMNTSDIPKLMEVLKNYADENGDK